MNGGRQLKSHGTSDICLYHILKDDKSLIKDYGHRVWTSEGFERGVLLP